MRITASWPIVGRRRFRGLASTTIELDTLWDAEPTWRLHPSTPVLKLRARGNRDYAAGSERSVPTANYPLG